MPGDSDPRPPKPPKRERLVPDPDKIDDAVLALLLLGEHDYQRVWKSFDWDAMERLYDKGMISDSKSRAKSVVLTDEGREEAVRLFKLLFSKR